LTGNQRQSLHREKVCKGAEKSSPRRRGNRGSRRGKVRARVGKTRRPPKPRPEPKKLGRKSRREAREQSWVGKRSAEIFDRMTVSIKNKTDVESILPRYNAISGQVRKMSSHTAPIPFFIFYRQVEADNTPWCAEPDICLRVRLIRDYDAFGTNIHISGSDDPPRGVIRLRDPTRKKTRVLLCRTCGTTREDGTDCARCRPPVINRTRKKKEKRVRSPGPCPLCPHRGVHQH